MRPWLHALVCIGIAVIAAPPVSAQEDVGGRGATVTELVVGHAGFVDDALIHHAVIGGSIRQYVLPRVSIGPELVYMRGPRDDRDVMLTGNVTFDLLSPAPRRPVMPFVVAGAGLFRHSDRIGQRPFSSSEGAFTAGAGVRAAVSHRMYVGAEWRVGWELHSRITAIVGVRVN